MTNAAGQRDTSRSPDNTGFGSVRVQAKRGDEGRFYLGLVALVAIMVFATLAVIALLPTLVPRATSASITSGSMMPKLRPGDVVIAVDQGDTPIAIGTIVVFEDPRARWPRHPSHRWHQPRWDLHHEGRRERRGRSCTGPSGERSRCRPLGRPVRRASECLAQRESMAPVGPHYCGHRRSRLAGQIRG